MHAANLLKYRLLYEAGKRMSEHWKLIFTRQMRQPEGLFGIVISYILNVINFKQNDLTLQVLDIQDQDRILEIGFGNGKYIEQAARQASQGLVAGIDHSPTMIRSATRRNRKWIARGVVEIKLGSIASIPYPKATFDKVFSVNTIYFWPAPAENLQEIYQLQGSPGQDCRL
jgi:ubiquinone/menaquinone biosynthesis C-methylase UbiE